MTNKEIANKRKKLDCDIQKEDLRHYRKLQKLNNEIRDLQKQCKHTDKHFYTAQYDSYSECDYCGFSG